MFIRSLGFVLFVSAMIFGNTYYIDYSGGSDANPGTSKSAPWKRCPGMNGFAATYTHTPGDVCIFKGGIIWPSAALPFAVANSGATGNTDIYTTDHSWYAGSTWAQPTFDGELFQKTLLYASEKSHVRINDLRLINAGMAAANGIIAFQFSNCSYFELSNNTLTPQSWGCLYVITERTGDFNDFFIHHNDISACAFGMRFVPGAAASIMHNVQVYNNSIHDFKSQLSGEVHGDGIQYYNTPDVAASYDRYIDGFKIFNNRFYGDFSQVSGSGGAMTALVYLSGASIGVQIYNNLFAPQYSGSQSPNFFESFISLRDNPNRGGHHKIYNNTFVTPVTDGQAAAILEDDTRYPSPSLDIKNNIFSNFNWPYDLRSTNHTIDYNDEYFVRDIGKWAGNFVGSFANWQALGLDVHGISANPGFVSSTNQHLAATSPCIGKGTNLSTVVATDLDGNARPGSAGFSLGAYEFGAAPPPPMVPSAPALSLPAAGATSVAINPALSWSAVSGAASYSVQVSTVSGFASTSANQTGITTTSYQANGLSNNTTYYWRVNATNASGTSSWSSSGNFTTVAAALLPSTLVLWWPANGATGIVINPSLTWSPDSGALSYAVQVSTDSSFAATIVNQTGITATDYEANGLSNNTTYYWRVNSTKASGTTSWSSPGTFTTAVGAPSALVLSSPANSATGVVTNPILSWSSVPNALSYSVQVSTVSSFASTVVNQAGIASTSCPVSGLSNNTTYYWRVNALNASGAGSWSTSGTFTTVAALPSPTLTLWWPATGAIGIVINPSLTWSPDSGALSYALQVSTDSAFASAIINQTGITETSFEANGLSYATAYYWRVNVTKASGTSGWSSAAKFTTAKPPSNAFLQDSSANGIVSIDAEHYMANIGQNGHTWEKVLKTGYAGECAMQALPNNGTSINTGYAVNSPRMDYLVNFIKTGKQYIWARGIGPSGNDDSYHAGIDGKETGTCDRISSFTAKWKWSKNDMDGSAAYFTVAAAGEHTVNIWMREDGFIIDKIVITTNPNYVPTGTGPAESGNNGLKKKMVPGTPEDIRPVPQALDIYSCRNGVVQMSLPFAGAYRLTMYALSGKKAGIIAENIGSAGPNAVSLRNMKIPQGFYLMQLSVKGINANRKIYVTN
jgi:hypothetical protein